jgi:hypothetical protein
VASATGVFSALSLFAVTGSAAPTNPTIPLKAAPVRSTEPIVLTGSQFPAWSAGPEFTFHEPMSPLNSNVDGSTPGSPQGPEPKQLQSACYDPNANYGGGGGTDPAKGDHNCYQPSRLPLRTIPVTKGVDPRRVLGYRWDANLGQFVQIPFQVDQVFTRYLSNNESDFAFYSGTDQHIDYAYDREGFRWLSNCGAPGVTCPSNKPANIPDVCWSMPYKSAQAGNFYDGQAATPSPNGFHLVDKDEMVFMAKDAGAAAPQGAAFPAGVLDAYKVHVADPFQAGTTNEASGYIYVALAGDKGPAPQYTAANSPYVHYQPDADAGMFIYSRSSYGGYGAAPSGQYCNADGTLSVDATGKPNVAQRRPKDTAWVWTPRYAFRYDGRWLMTEIHVSDNGDGYVDASGGLHNYGPNVVDRWKARAFQQSPGGHTPCCGYEEEATNWGGSSQLFGEKAGPVRVIRATWGADSSTNNVRREIFYNDQVRYQDALRVHVIPPFDGIYVQRDMAAGTMDTYYNPYQKQGVPVLGINEEVFGNVHSSFGSNGLCYSSQDKAGSLLRAVTGTPSIQVLPPGSTSNCDNNDVHGDFDFFDPTFSGPPGALAWEETTGDHGTLVERWTANTYSPGGVLISAATAFPYYRDDSCFDDGTGTDPGPKLNLRSKDEPKTWWYDPATGQPTSGFNPPAGVATNPRRCWNHHVDGTPYNIPGTKSFDPLKPVESSDPTPNPRFGPQGDVRYFQGDIGTHGLHVIMVADSDNAQMTVPVDELDSEQIQVILPGRQGNVGEAYGRAFEKPLLTTEAPADGLMVETLGLP